MCWKRFVTVLVSRYIGRYKVMRGAWSNYFLPQDPRQQMQTNDDISVGIVMTTGAAVQWLMFQRGCYLTRGETEFQAVAPDGQEHSAQQDIT